MSQLSDGNVAILTVALVVVLWCAAIVSYALVRTRKSYRELGLPARGGEGL